LRSELHPDGLEIVTVCLEMTGVEAARPWIDAARPEHPSLIDTAHQVDALFGMVNIPNAVWIDEQGVIVRPAEPAWPARRETPRPPATDGETGGGTSGDTGRSAEGDPAPAAPVVPQRVRQMLAAVGRSKIDRTRYVPAVRDWVANGASSRFALSPDEVVSRSRPRDAGEAAGAAHFELGQHLWRLGHIDTARHHFREAHRLQPDNWTYKRQAWSIEPSEVGGAMERLWQGPVEGGEAAWPYEGDFLTDVVALGDEDYYPVPDDMRAP
jgi:hypothetical protein